MIMHSNRVNLGVFDLNVLLVSRDSESAGDGDMDKELDNWLFNDGSSSFS